MRYKSIDTKNNITQAIEEFFFENKRAPSITEIVKKVGHSRSTVHAYLQEMNSEGTICYDGKVLSTPVIVKADAGTVLTPVLGSVICGEPQYEEQNFEEYIALPTALFGKGQFFLLRAKGESMIEASINPGDLVVVRKQNTAKDGDIVVALVNNETTLKRFYSDKEKQCIRLHPENKTMEDIYTQQCYIQGVAQHIIKIVR